MQSLNDVWKIAVAEMKEEFSDAMINLWFAPLELTLLDDDTVEVIERAESYCFKHHKCQNASH